MHWLREYWFWLLFGILFVWVHARMHGSHHHHHGGHGHQGDDGDQAGQPCHAHATREDSDAQR